MIFTTSLSSNIGGRDKNDDYAGYMFKEGSYGAWITADGLGGHVDGDVASRIAVESSLKAFEENNSLEILNIENIISKANLDIINAQSDHKASNGMRTTLVALFTDSKKVVWAHVGDTRLYYFKNGSLSARTKDHSVSQLAVSSGDISEDQIRFHEDRNKLLRVLGTGPELKVDVLKQPLQVEAGDAFLLCTDGFWEYVYEAEMEIDFSKAASPQQWVSFMIERLYMRIPPGNDNFTAVAVFVE
ncbi:PP2C family protein-serine/threonine phosphatase [Clostridium fungisolvens]|uniref:Protein phosphatase PrpC n=1 Tax=Clostridium fungisolvens TaxID=1604897 RepID=A0A6V8SJZ9_9CLOT|nr:protein phosphatase 2C domain-containing protein [Clostridium fungisolvens]GFP75488.1 Protein phosphatase PrpC [Clostridium fungisolvens]